MIEMLGNKKQIIYGVRKLVQENSMQVAQAGKQGILVKRIQEGKGNSITKVGTKKHYNSKRLSMFCHDSWLLLDIRSEQVIIICPVQSS